MYKLLLSWRYLRTRYIALVSIVSVMLGVATMIVVNSVMAGFTTEMQNRIHGILSDLTFEARSLDGMPDPAWHMQQIEKIAGDSIQGMTPTVVVPAMLNFRYGGEWITRQVQLVGIDEETHSRVSDFGDYLQHPQNRRQMSFRLHEQGYDTRDHQAGPETPERSQMKHAGWVHRRRVAQAKAVQRQLELLTSGGRPGTPGNDSEAEGGETGGPAESPAEGPPPGMQHPNDGPPEDVGPTLQLDPFTARRAEEPTPSAQFDPAREQHTGAVPGIALTSCRRPQPDGSCEDCFLALPGDDVTLTFPTAGTPPKAISDKFTIVDFYESKMSEYDASFVFVPIEKMQELRGMIDPASGVRRVNSIQIKLKPGADGAAVRDRLRAYFAPQRYGIYTWRDKQGPLLAAVHMETAILNVLLFLIIAVAGFGILAIFLMIVVEKTRDIGILKSLGASSKGVMGIFLAYGLSLGLVGSGVGLVLGLLFVKYINEIADLLGKITGRPVFDPTIYYFYRIPTIVDPLTIAWIVAGAIAIAVLASILPAFRAAWLHPVEALRYE